MSGFHCTYFGESNNEMTEIVPIRTFIYIRLSTCTDALKSIVLSDDRHSSEMMVPQEHIYYFITIFSLFT